MMGTPAQGPAPSSARVPDLITSHHSSSSSTHSRAPPCLPDAAHHPSSSSSSSSSPPIFRPWQLHVEGDLSVEGLPVRRDTLGESVEGMATSRGRGLKRPAPHDSVPPTKLVKTEEAGEGTRVRVGRVLPAGASAALVPHHHHPQVPTPTPAMPAFHLALLANLRQLPSGTGGPAPAVGLNTPQLPGLGTSPGLQGGLVEGMGGRMGLGTAVAGLGGATTGLGGLGAHMVTPLVPLLDMLVPAAEVERVCARRPRPKRFSCSQCGSAFSNKGQLKGHLRIHTGERPYECLHEGCHKRFTRNEELTRHRRIHSGARPYPCPLCDKRFGRKDHLKKHVRTHTRHPLLPHHHHHHHHHPLLHHLHQLQ